MFLFFPIASAVCCQTLDENDVIVRSQPLDQWPSNFSETPIASTSAILDVTEIHSYGPLDGIPDLLPNWTMEQPKKEVFLWMQSRLVHSYISRLTLILVEDSAVTFDPWLYHPQYSGNEGDWVFGAVAGKEIVFDFRLARDDNTTPHYLGIGTSLKKTENGNGGELLTFFFNATQEPRTYKFSRLQVDYASRVEFSGQKRFHCWADEVYPDYTCSLYPAPASSLPTMTQEPLTPVIQKPQPTDVQDKPIEVSQEVQVAPPVASIKPPPPPPISKLRKKEPRGTDWVVIVGVIGAGLVLVVCILAVFFLWKKSERGEKKDEEEDLPLPYGRPARDMESPPVSPHYARRKKKNDDLRGPFSLPLNPASPSKLDGAHYTFYGS